MTSERETSRSRIENYKINSRHDAANQARVSLKINKFYQPAVHRRNYISKVSNFFTGMGKDMKSCIDTKSKSIDMSRLDC